MEIRAKNLRVYLKSLEARDADEMAKNADNDEIAYCIGRPGEFPHPYTRENALAFIEDAAREYKEKSAFHFGIRLNASALVGVCGAHTLDYSNVRGEIGYWLGRDYWGKGYAKEALALLLGFCFNSLRLNKVSATVLAFNERSINLLRSLNFAKEGTLRQNTLRGGMFVDDIVFSMLKHEYDGSADSGVETTE
jgi:RimJ/RimL family protein N-acetyltransferase